MCAVSIVTFVPVSGAVIAALLALIAAVVQQTRELRAARLQRDRADRRAVYDEALEAAICAGGELGPEHLNRLETAARKLEIRTDPLHPIAVAFRAVQADICGLTNLSARAQWAVEFSRREPRFDLLHEELPLDRFIRLAYADQAGPDVAVLKEPSPPNIRYASGERHQPPEVPETAQARVRT